MEKPDQLPEPQEATLHVAALPDGSAVVVYGPGIVLRFDPGEQLDKFVSLLREAQTKAIMQQEILKVINASDPLPLPQVSAPPDWFKKEYAKLDEAKADRLSNLPNAGHGDFKNERYRK